ncbi:hypothetical protein BJ912DRAFT_1031893 [Pholiota molesta]|nr:hypothetical protein BJ912DRAFT_1031893 [Pholiota molesta]
MAAVFNPKILDASIRDVASYLSDNQKVDLLLYAMRSFPFEGRSRTVIENAIQSCLQVATLSPENVAKARILRARARRANGLQMGAQEDLHAALLAEPDNPEAKALLHQRSVTVEKLLSPLPPHHLKDRVSNEVWREVALHLPRRDLKALLFVPHPLSRIASQLLFWELDLHFTGAAEGVGESDEDDGGGGGGGGYYHSGSGSGSGAGHGGEGAGKGWRGDEASHAQRSADILTRIITDPVFASAVRTLRIYAFRRDRDGSSAFQTGMLTNALPRLINLRNVHLSATSDGIVPVLRILQRTSPRLRGLSLKSPDSPADLSFLDFRHLTHFAYATSAALPSGSGAPPPATAAFHALLAQNKTTLRTIALDLSPSFPSPSSSFSSGNGNNNPQALPGMAAHWTFPTSALRLRNLTAVFFTGAVPASSALFAALLAGGRQLETLDVSCSTLDSASLSAQVRAADPGALPFLRSFAFTVGGLGRRVVDRDLFPSIAGFLRGREGLRSLNLVVLEEGAQAAVGFDAAAWGVLPSLQLRPGIPPTLRFVGLTDVNVRNAAAVVEAGFPMVRVVRIGNSYWTLEQWPRRRAMYHAREWLEWLGCEDAMLRDPSAFVG